MLAKHAWDDRSNLSHKPLVLQIRDLLQRRVGRYKLLRDHESRSSSVSSSKSHGTSSSSSGGATELLLGAGNDTEEGGEDAEDGGLTLQQTARLSLEFCMLWFCANYFAAACLGYTTVASATILGSTSSIWTLLCGAVLRVERFTLRKFVGVIASLFGVVLISSLDATSGSTDENRGSFPAKSPRELALGDAMAFLSAVLYGFYAILMKKRIGDETKVNMPLFFGLVGLANVFLLWPGLTILHLTGIEPFELPPTKKIAMIVVVNSASSLVSDFSWAYAMLLTSPLVVSVGLSLTIPLSLVGQMVLNGQGSGVWYWVGAGVMFCSFVWISREQAREEEVEQARGEAGRGV
jgi:solute carrier family 35 protein F5